MPQLSGPSHRSCRTRVAPSRATERPKPRMTNVYPQSLFPRARRIREDFQLDFSSYRGESARNLSHARSVPPTQCGRSAFVRPLTSVGTTTRPRSSPRPAQGPGAVRHPGAAQGHAAPVLPLSDQRRGVADRPDPPGGLQPLSQGRPYGAASSSICRAGASITVKTRGTSWSEGGTGAEPFSRGAVRARGTPLPDQKPARRFERDNHPRARSCDRLARHGEARLESQCRHFARLAYFLKWLHALDGRTPNRCRCGRPRPI